ncbi:hypothetical protein D3C86_1890080 [compost metagenome]
MADPLGGEKTVYVSANQWRELKANLASGYDYDAFPPPLDKQFKASAPPMPAEG